MKKAIAIDFDGCLCTNEFPAIGKPNWAVINRAKAEQRSGAGLILWTCREGELLQEAVNACKSWGLTFDSVNESLPDWIETFGNQPRKVGATEYWDDKAARIPTALRFFVGGPSDDSIEMFESAPDNENLELKPCPFCGSTHVFYERYRHRAGERWRCWCAECLAGIDPGTAQEMWPVRDMWNRRVEPPNLPLTLEQLREMDGEPVWIADLLIPGCSCYHFVQKIDGHYLLIEPRFYPAKDVMIPHYCANDENQGYGKTWIAYRRKPEDANK